MTTSAAATYTYYFLENYEGCYGATFQLAEEGVLRDAYTITNMDRTDATNECADTCASKLYRLD
jgi:hypothetical protein